MAETATAVVGTRVVVKVGGLPEGVLGRAAYKGGAFEIKLCGSCFSCGAQLVFFHELGHLLAGHVKPVERKASGIDVAPPGDRATMLAALLGHVVDQMDAEADRYARLLLARAKQDGIDKRLLGMSVERWYAGW